MAPSMFIKPAQAEQDLKWAKIWFKKFAAFHNRSPLSQWDFSPDDLIAFLRSKRDAGVPAWKRMKVIRGLLIYRRFIAEQPIDDFLPIKQKMEQIITIERARNDGYDSIDESVGKINPKEPDAIQEFRRALRRDGKSITNRTVLCWQAKGLHGRVRTDVS